MKGRKDTLDANGKKMNSLDSISKSDSKQFLNNDKMNNEEDQNASQSSRSSRRFQPVMIDYDPDAFPTPKLDLDEMRLAWKMKDFDYEDFSDLKLVKQLLKEGRYSKATAHLKKWRESATDSGDNEALGVILSLEKELKFQFTEQLIEDAMVRGEVRNDFLTDLEKLRFNDRGVFMDYPEDFHEIHDKYKEKARLIMKIVEMNIVNMGTNQPYTEEDLREMNNEKLLEIQCPREIMTRKDHALLDSIIDEPERSMTGRKMDQVGLESSDTVDFDGLQEKLRAKQEREEKAQKLAQAKKKVQSWFHGKKPSGREMAQLYPLLRKAVPEKISSATERYWCCCTKFNWEKIDWKNMTLDELNSINAEVPWKVGQH